MKRAGVYGFGPGMFPPPGPEFDAFQDRAVAGDEATRLAFANHFLGFPEDIATVNGDVAAEAEDRLIRLHAGKNIVKQEAIRAKLRLVRAELAEGGPDPTGIERLLLIDRVALCGWPPTMPRSSVLWGGEGAGRRRRGRTAGA